MGAPDKIFIKLIPSEHGGYVYSTACNGDEYVRKDALLEWAKETKAEIENNNGIKEDVRNGAVWELEELIAKIESL